MHPEWLSNAYLIADEPGGHGVIVDSGADPQPLLDAVERNELTIPYLLLTHHHHDHVAENSVYKERLGVEILAHPLEAEHLMDVDRAIEPCELIEVGGLRIDGLHTPGHTAGMLSFRVGDEAVFTGDTLFKGSVGGVRAPGHTDPTTVADEWEHNAFIRVWRGLDEESTDRCKVGEDEATLVLFAPDYDGGHKAWVRWDESGRDDIVPGSMVER